MEADHQPSLAEHWSGPGKGSTQDVRHAVAKQVKGMNQAENSRIGGRGGSFRGVDATASFTSTGTATKGRWWCTVDEPFLNAPGLSTGGKAAVPKLSDT
jgi:hypothetical protein